ncbi:hypothetical protein BsWGS_07554 [Bradybaena similaris]
MFFYHKFLLSWSGRQHKHTTTDMFFITSFSYPGQEDNTNIQQQTCFLSQVSLTLVRKTTQTYNNRHVSYHKFLLSWSGRQHKHTTTDMFLSGYADVRGNEQACWHCYCGRNEWLCIHH